MDEIGFLFVLVAFIVHILHILYSFMSYSLCMWVAYVGVSTVFQIEKEGVEKKLYSFSLSHTCNQTPKAMTVNFEHHHGPAHAHGERRCECKNMCGTKQTVWQHRVQVGWVAEQAFVQYHFGECIL